ncbi:unnamed protein product, partial [Ectocarpus fasciculatus]
AGAYHNNKDAKIDKIIQLLLDAGADPDTTDPDGQHPPLLLAVHANKPKMIRSLIAAGANPNITSRQGLTPIGLAVNMGFSGCLAVLLRSGGSPHSNNSSGPTLVQSAFLELYPTCLALLFQAGVATENMFADSEPYSADLLKRVTTNYKLDTPGGRCQQILLVAKAYNARSWQWPSSAAIATSANQNEQKEGDGAGKGVVGSKPARKAASWMRQRRGVFVPAVLRYRHTFYRESSKFRVHQYLFRWFRHLWFVTINSNMLLLETRLGLALGLLLFRLASAYDCPVVTREATTNYGTGISDEAHEGLTPFELGTWKGVVAFNEDHCVQMCCERLECYVAVFDHAEALCYLKAAGAMETTAFVSEEGFTTFELFVREGDPSPVAIEPTECQSKRGVSFDFKDADDLDALAPGMSWWYNWSPAMITSEVKVAQSASGCEYIPMIWGEKDLDSTRLANLDSLDQSSYMLGFNEPNFGSQANLTPQEAAALWSTVKSEAATLGAEIVSPAVNFCGGDCTKEDPYEWLDEFFSACEGIDGGCEVTAIAVHIYTCEVRYLNKIIYGYLKYDLPIWVTEFACADDAAYMTEASQAAYLADALRLLELHPSVARYAWFTGRGGDDVGVTGSDLLSATGVLTDVGSVFVETYQDLQRCEDVTSSLSTGSLPSSTPTNIAEPGTMTGMTDVDPEATEITNVVIGNLGGTGTYMDVIGMDPGANMHCPSTEAACVQEEVSVSGTLAPFDEAVSVAFRGPMNIHNIVWFEGETDSLSKTSAWTPVTSDNLVFMTNQGGYTDCSGEWTICGGSSQSYADETGSSCASEPKQFDGVLGGDQGVNIMTSTECADEATCGFYRDTGMEGWSGGLDGSKVMVFEVDMPHCGTEGFDDCTWNRPAVWALNSKVVRTAQYGCNCRGAGGNGGCGEFDIVEAVIGVDHADMMFTTVYDFKGTGAPGHGKYFNRPSEPTHYAAIFRGGEDAYLQVVQLTEFDYSQTTLSGEWLNELKLASTENHDVYDVPGQS